MSVLTIVQDACKQIGLAVPSAVMASTDREHVELARVARMMSLRIARAHSWELFRTLKTETGDGTTEDFDLPDDYAWTPKDQKLWSSRLSTPLTHITSTDEWLELDVRSYEFVVGAWIVYGGQLHIKPAPQSGEEVSYFYQSNKIAATGGGVAKEAFTADDDEFRLDDETLKLGIIYRWREMKGLPYEEDMADYEESLGQQIERDGGGDRILRSGRRRLIRGARVAYPVQVGP
jgi:hypothetical protein